MVSTLHRLTNKDTNKSEKVKKRTTNRRALSVLLDANDSRTKDENEKKFFGHYLPRMARR